MATVLVVDDVAANREFVALLLGCRGHDVLQAPDGDAALALARSRHPDVVVSDVLMPGVDGLELAHRLRSDTDPGAARAPVIFYTANYLEPETRPIAEACGVSRVVLRDGDPRELLDAVDEALRAGPVDVRVGPPGEFARAHAQTVNAKLVEKVKALHQTECQFEAMASVSPVGMALLDADGDATYVNPRLTEITGRPATLLLGQGWLCCLEPGSRREATETVRDPAAETIEHRYRARIRRTDQDTRWLRVHLRPFREAEYGRTGAVLLVDDVTDVVDADERAAREARQRQEAARRSDADRLDSLRRLAGGIAHDYNNLLGAMLGYLQLASESIAEEKVAGRLAGPTAAALLDDLAHAARGGERAAKLTEQLLAFGRREINEPDVVELSDFVRRAAGRLTRIAGTSVALDVQLAERVPPVSIDPRALDRLLDILVRNSCEAMAAGGTIVIRTVAAGPAGEPGGGITVADTGPGMSPEVRRRAFEPFFSTRPGGRTAGLGLSTAHGIVSQAGGTIELSSGPGGTSVEIRLPAATTPVRSGTVVAEPPAGGVAGDRTVLLVDDDEEMRRITTRFITRAGYHVLVAANGPEALAVAEQHAGEIHCVVTDVVMPGMDGRQLAHRLLELRPGLKVVFISGFAEALIDEEGRSLEPGRTIVAKPYSRAQLQQALTAALATG